MGLKPALKNEPLKDLKSGLKSACRLCSGMRSVLVIQLNVAMIIEGVTAEK